MGGSAGPYFNIQGDAAVPRVKVLNQTSIYPKDVQALVLWVLGDLVPAPRWAVTERRLAVPQVVLVLANGLTEHLFKTHKAVMPTLASMQPPAILLAAKCSTRPSDSAAALLNVPLTKKRKREVDVEEAAAQKQRRGLPPFPPSHYVATLEQLQQNSYPVPLLGDDGELLCPEGFVSSADGVGGGAPAAAAAAGADGGTGGSGVADAAGCGGAGAEGDGALAGGGCSNGCQGVRSGTNSGGGMPGSPANGSSECEHSGLGAATAEGAPVAAVAAASAAAAPPPSHAALTPPSSLPQQQPGAPPPPPQQQPGAPPPPPLQVAARPLPSVCCGEHLVGIDCEMVVTTAGFELARVSAIDAAGTTLLDMLVRPDRPITDHNTRFSGITPEMMASTSARLEDARAALLALMRPDTLLVGHALENDLAALKLLHARVLDTALLYPHPRGPPAKCALRILAQRHLRRTIQRGEAGHDSVVDAVAAMDLVLLKVAKGPSYGTPEACHTDKLPDVLMASGQAGPRRAPLRSLLLDRKDVLHRHASSHAAQIMATSDAQAAAEAAKQVRAGRYEFVWLQLYELNILYVDRVRACRVARAGVAQGGGDEAAAAAGAAQGNGGEVGAAQGAAQGGGGEAGAAQGGGNEAAGAAREAQQQQEQQQQPQQQGPMLDGKLQQGEQQAAGAGGGEELVRTLRRLDDHVAQVYAALPPNALLIVATGQGDTAECGRLSQEKYRRQQRLDGLPPWTQADEEAYHAFVAQEMRALCFCAVKH